VGAIETNRLALGAADAPNAATMNHRVPFIALFSTLATFGCAGLAAADTPVYELRTFTAHPGKHEAVLARFRDHTCKLFEKHGMTNVGYWEPTDADQGAGEKLVYLLGHKSREAGEAAFAAFGSDPEWQKVRDASEANGKIVASVESIFITPTDYSASFNLKPGKATRVFELRTYKTLPGRLPNLDARFRNHTCKLFAKHGMTNLGYFHPMDAGKGVGDTLIYFLAHDSRDAAKASWAAFQADPVWVAARDASEADGKLLQSRGVTSVFLKATDFSAVK